MSIGRVALGLLSMGARSPSGDDAAYLEWHALDHMPEQFRIDGLLHGQRWVSTAALRAARAAEDGHFTAVDHVVQYLVSEPVAPAVDAWFDLGAELAKAGRYPARLPSVMLAGFVPDAGAASAHATVTAAAVPFRPTTGAYLVLDERPDAPTDGSDAYDAWLAEEHLPSLCALPGVAGAWHFAPAAIRPDRLDPRGLALTVAYLDGDPLDVATSMLETLPGAWRRWGIRAALAAPFATVRPWQWETELG